MVFIKLNQMHTKNKLSNTNFVFVIFLTTKKINLIFQIIVYEVLLVQHYIYLPVQIILFFNGFSLRLDTIGIDNLTCNHFKMIFYDIKFNPNTKISQFFTHWFRISVIWFKIKRNIIKKIMGSSTSKAPGITNLDLLEWREIGIHRETAKIV